MLSGHRHQVQQGLQHRRWRASAAFLGARGSRRMEAAKIVSTLSQQVLDIHIRLREIDRDLLVWQRGNDVARRLMTIPGIGPVGATALAASITDPHQFRSGRQFAAWLGLTPLQKRAAAKSGSGASPKSAPRKTMPCEIPASQERSPALPCVGRVEVRRHFPVPKGVDGNSRSLPP
jgi:transposase